MRFTVLAMALAATAGLAVSAQAATNLVVNGGFETVTSSSRSDPSTSGEFGSRYSTRQVAGWTTSGYNWVFSNPADTGCNNGEYGCLQLHGPANGTANGLTASPTGGNYVAADGAFEVAPIQQTLTGLVTGKTYIVSFDWAAAQQNGFDGPTTEQWLVSLGGQTIGTSTYSNANHGFSGWMHESFSFTFDGANNVLSFLAVGTPNGLPPFSLLDGVSAVASVPEPATWGLMLVGFGLVGAAARRRVNAVAA